MDSTTLAILVVSISLQLLAAILAFRLIKKTTSTGHAWLLLSASMLLQSIRRVVTFVSTFFPAAQATLRGPVAELIGLGSSICIAAGTFKIPEMFAALFAAKAAAEHERKRAVFLAEVSESFLGASLDIQARARLLTQRAVPILADVALLDIVDNNQLQRVAVSHVAPAGEESVRACPQFPPSEPANEHPVAQAIQSGRPLLIPELTHLQVLAFAQDPELQHTLSSLEPHSCLVVPLVRQGEAIGALTLLRSAQRQAFDAGEQALADEFVRRGTLAIDNAMLYREAQDAIRSRDDFLAIASHELRTPLTPLQLQIHLIERKLNALAGDKATHEWIENHFGMIKRQGARLTRLVEVLLDVTRLTEGRLQLKLERVDLTQIVRDVVKDFVERGETVRSSSEIRVDVQDSILGYWDRMRLDQVVTNLISNALKYGAGKPITITAGLERGFATLTVKDEGIGIEPESQERIFGRFERAVSARHFGGLGLGLYIVRQVVEAMRGSLLVRSQPGEGATFIVSLPSNGASGQATNRTVGT